MDADLPPVALHSGAPWRLLHQQLLRYARSKVHDRMLAEDAVSEAVVVALQTQTRFTSLSHQRAWLIGVLKHKLADEIRRQARWTALEVGDDGELAHPNPADSVTETGDPAVQCAATRLRAELEQRCRQLPAAQRAAFTLRELVGLDANEICAAMGVTRNHLGVLVHRARRTLQSQLGAHR